MVRIQNPAPWTEDKDLPKNYKLQLRSEGRKKWRTVGEFNTKKAAHAKGVQVARIGWGDDKRKSLDNTHFKVVPKHRKRR